MEVKDKPFTIEIAKNILRNAHWEKRFNAYLNDVVTYVTEKHEKRGGTFLTSNMTTKAFVKRALDALEQDGLAYNISKNIWEFPKHGQRLFGKGTEWVYLYYYDTYKRHAQREGRNVWNCKIGYAEKNPEKTIHGQKTPMPEKPTIALLLRTDDCKNLEKLIHAALKLLGKHFIDAPGKEWFLTNPDEVATLYDNLQFALDQTLYDNLQFALDLTKE